MHNHVYEDIATKFFEHFLHIAEAINNIGDEGRSDLWDEEDEFYYDVLESARRPQSAVENPFAGRLIPLFAVETLENR